MSSTMQQESSGNKNSQSVRFFTYGMFHGKNETVGSDYLRALQLIKYWDEAELYKYGENPDVLIFNKVFCGEDYQFPKHFENIKILDICDPMWIEGHAVVQTAQAMDAVTCTTENLAEFIRQFKKEVYVVPDRFDLELLPKPKVHTEQAKSVVWFGYSHNAELLKPAIGKLESLGLNLIIISNDDPIANRWGLRDKKEYYTFVKYNEATIYQELQKADFAILPDGARPEDYFKSNNKTIKANLAGLPVAKTAEDVDLYMKAENRRKWYDENYATIKAEYDVRKSIEQYKVIIAMIAGK